MAICKEHSCNKQTYKGNDSCILHIAKSSDYHTDRNSGLLNDFYNALLECLIDKFFQYKTDIHDPEAEKKEFEKYLKGDRLDFSLENYPFHIPMIQFPHHDGRDYYDYLKILNKLQNIHFDTCSFQTSGLDLKNTKVFFQDCVFLDSWYLSNYGILINVYDIIYQNCAFNSGVVAYSNDDEVAVFNYSQFCDCRFSHKIELEKVVFKKALFNDSERNDLEFNNLQFFINGCTFNDRFIFNGYTLDEVNIKRTEFDKFKFKGNNVNSFTIRDCNFNNILDCFNSKFIEFNIFKCIFRDFAGFEKCSFGELNKYSLKYVATINYSTFLSFLNFRDANFLSGINIKTINTTKPANFLGCKVEQESTNRESFSIIKNSFNSQGNKIDANRFFSKEMIELCPNLVYE